MLYSAFISEIYRAALEAVPRGQREASLALGLGKTRTFVQVILPQATKIAIPNIGSMFIGMVKDTSVFTVIGLLEITRVSQQANSLYYQAFVFYTAAAVIYVVIAFMLDFLFRGIERDPHDAAEGPDRAGRHGTAAAADRAGRPARGSSIRCQMKRPPRQVPRTRRRTHVTGGRSRIRLVAVVAALTALAASIAASSVSASRSAGDNGLMDPSTLVVGMDLEFKPQMYLQNGKPAGYDVVLLNMLAKQLGVKLKIENLAFDGLIPGLQAKKFDMVSVGLSYRPERAKVISFSRAYVPYAQILAARKGDTTPSTIAAWNNSGKTITSLEGSTAEQLVQKTFPKASSKSFPEQNAAFLEVSTGRADGIVVENYLLAQFNKSNGNKLKQVGFTKPLHVEYGSYAVQKGNTALVKVLNKFICTIQGNGQLAKAYKQTEGADLPPMPGC